MNDDDRRAAREAVCAELQPDVDQAIRELADCIAVMAGKLSRICTCGRVSCELALRAQVMDAIGGVLRTMLGLPSDSEEDTSAPTDVADVVDSLVSLNGELAVWPNDFTGEVA